MLSRKPDGVVNNLRLLHNVKGVSVKFSHSSFLSLDGDRRSVIEAVLKVHERLKKYPHTYRQEMCTLT